MPKTAQRTLVFTVAMLLAKPALRAQSLQTVVNEKDIALDAAQLVAQGALQACRATGYRVSITVLDRSGTVKVFLRDEGSNPHTVDFSHAKAYTALTFRRSSSEIGKLWAEHPPAPNIAGTVGTAGGVPIKVGSDVIGAIGVSGSPGGDKDEVCANEGIAKIADQIKGFISPTP